ncbi:MAG: hypothetical protein P8M80_14245 [Pirellulaceae bacterium]|nr:hypothetical protein [Pirellulaceae bacterium]
MRIQETLVFFSTISFTRAILKPFAVTISALILSCCFELTPASAQIEQASIDKIESSTGKWVAPIPRARTLSDLEVKADDDTCSQSSGASFEITSYVLSDRTKTGEPKNFICQSKIVPLENTDSQLTSFSLTDQAISNANSVINDDTTFFSLTDCLPAGEGVIAQTSFIGGIISDIEDTVTFDPTSPNSDSERESSYPEELVTNTTIVGEANPAAPTPPSDAPYPAVFDPSPYLVQAAEQPLDSEQSLDSQELENLNLRDVSPTPPMGTATLLDPKEYLVEATIPEAATENENSVVRLANRSPIAAEVDMASPSRDANTTIPYWDIPKSSSAQENIENVADLGTPIPANPFAGLNQEDPLGLLSQRPSLARQQVILDDYRMIPYSELVNVPAQQHYAFWTGTRFCHRPLYFEEACLERNGSTHACQTLISFGNFAGNILLFPYHLGVTPPRHCLTTMGHVSPGQCVPCKKPFRPINSKGAVIQGLVTAALFL